jgi:hypothetical protein
MSSPGPRSRTFVSAHLIGPARERHTPDCDHLQCQGQASYKQAHPPAVRGPLKTH